jgi:hypothetical protein
MESIGVLPRNRRDYCDEVPFTSQFGGRAPPTEQFLADSVCQVVMNTFAAIAILLMTTTPVQAQETDVTGKWMGTLTRTLPDGRTQSIDFMFNLTQKGKDLTGTAGPNAERQWTIEQGVVDGTTVTFQVQQPDGPLRTCRLTLVNDRLQGDMMLEYNGQTAEVKVNMARAE